MKQVRIESAVRRKAITTSLTPSMNITFNN